jgi:hypothetical protein
MVRKRLNPGKTGQNGFPLPKGEGQGEGSTTSSGSPASAGMDLRCDYLANKGTDTLAIQAYLGHQSIQHTVRYTELAAGRFEGFWGTSRTCLIVKNLWYT